MKSFIDTNIFVYASYLSFPQHEASKSFLKDCIQNKNQYCISWSVIYEYLRVVTHPQIFPKDGLTLKQAIQNVMNFLSSPNVGIISESEDHISSLLDMSEMATASIRGNLVHDAHAVVLMQENGVTTIYTTDTDYHRFKGIKVKNPLN